MLPRSDEIVLGGTFEPGETNLDPDEATVRRIVVGHAAFFSAMHRTEEPTLVQDDLVDVVPYLSGPLGCVESTHSEPSVAPDAAIAAPGICV